MFSPQYPQYARVTKIAPDGQAKMAVLAGILCASHGPH